MPGRSSVVWFGTIVLWVALATPAQGRVVQFVVEETRPYAEGRSFGDVGPYERLTGTVHMEVDPTDPLNAVIVNLDRAPRTPDGMVAFSAPFVIIKPVDMSRGNRKLYYGINNRGNPNEFNHFTFPLMESGVPPEFGDGLIFRLGYTFVDAGWAGDVITTADPQRLGANLPVAVRADGSPAVGPARIEYSGSGFSFPLKGNDRFISYETADTDTGSSSLTVRDSIRGPRRPIPADRWAFGRCPTGRSSLEPSTTDICLFDGFDADRIYELVYPASGPWVMGLGYAVTRDVASFLRSRTTDDAGNANPVALDPADVGIRRAYGFGASSTGMYLREFLYLGFNEDEAHQKVFDAVRIAIPGTHRLFANVAFADPNVYARQDQHPDFLSSSYPPLTYAVTTDPISGVRDGILKRPATDPLVIHFDTANEFWQMKASLNVHDGLGAPVPEHENVRLYFLASHAHIGAAGVGAMPTATRTCALPVNGYSSHEPFYRVIIALLDDWADRGIEPPDSRYPDVRDGTLVTLEEAARAFPAIPGLRFPTMLNELRLLDFGPEFGPAGGWLTEVPPAVGRRYEVLVPRPDVDGLDLGGIRTVDIAVPVGTNLGWNLRADGLRGNDLCGLQGGFVPFATTAAERQASGDPRLSLEERYTDHAGFVRAVEDAARRLVDERFLLEEDAETLISQAETSDVLQ